MEEYQDYWDELVPASDEAETLQGEMLRMAGRIMYDYLNNGFGNRREEETRFLDEHENLFKPHMKNPGSWDKFSRLYQEAEYGEGIQEDDRGYGNYYGGDDDDEDDYDTDDDWTSASDHLKYADVNVDEVLDDVMDGIIKYIRLTHDNLVPLT